MQTTTLPADLFCSFRNVGYLRSDQTKDFRRVLKIAKSNY